MSKQPVRGADVENLAPAVTSKLDDSGPSEAEIADYLQNNADFFERHATLLTKLKLPHSRGNATVSLVERQVSALREKNQALKRACAS